MILIGIYFIGLFGMLVLSIVTLFCEDDNETASLIFRHGLIWPITLGWLIYKLSIIIIKFMYNQVIDAFQDLKSL